MILMLILLILKIDPFKYLLKPKISWITLLLIQAVYLSFDIGESLTGHEILGILSASFMLCLGIIILVLPILENIYYGSRVKFPSLIEGSFYLLVGIILIMIRERRLKMNI